MRSLPTILLLGTTLAIFGQQPKEPMAPGKFEPSWESLKQYEVPEWFKNAKFGIWAHWGPQCQPEQGDWYARGMYDEGSGYYKWHVANYGHPSMVGFKDVCHDWKAQNWDPEHLVKLYKRCGAQYFFAMANHHDNFDLWDSKYQPWNSVNIGPKKDIVKGWANAAKKHNLRFGLSVHAAHAWTWYETAQRADKNGDKAGIPYDGKLSKNDGKGQWWDGYDPQDLYAQNHPLSENSLNTHSVHNQWDWGNGASVPSAEYCNKFYNRTVDLINRFSPDLLYFDDTALPLWPVSDVGLKIAAHYYNTNMTKHNGRNQAVLFGKILTDEQKDCMVWDVEKGAPDKIQPGAWQTCTCIGGWHYQRNLYENNRYKPPHEVVRMLVDVVSKNGNLLLNIPVRGDGSIDDKEEKVLEGIAAWMDINSEAIFDTRPWKVFGEGPIADQANPLNAQGFNEGIIRNLSAKDIRFTQKGKVVYAFAMGLPDDGQISIKSFGPEKIKNVQVLGYKKTKYASRPEGLTVYLPTAPTANKANPIVVKVTVK
ncbi:MAG: alpha-L-fucosidase [Breznakibacter sp.]